MWTSTDFKTYPKQFDFSSSYGNKPTFTALKIGDVEMINMVEELEGQVDEEQVFQFIICDHCGTTHCQSGNWVAIRQVDNYILLIPAFERMLEEQLTNEYEPPFSLRKNGALWFTIQDFNKLKVNVPAFNEIEKVKQLTIFETVSLYQWDTPHRMFGDFPNFLAMRTDHILTTSELEGKEIEQIISGKLKALETATKIHFVPLNENDKSILVILDDKQMTEWRPICKTENGYELCIGTFKIITEY